MSVDVFTSNVKSPPLFSRKSETLCTLPSQLKSCYSPDIYFPWTGLSHSSKRLLYSSAVDLCTVNGSPVNPLPSLPLPMGTWNASASCISWVNYTDGLLSPDSQQRPRAKGLERLFLDLGSPSSVLVPTVVAQVLDIPHTLLQQSLLLRFWWAFFLIVILLLWISAALNWLLLKPASFYWFCKDCSGTLDWYKHIPYQLL